MAPVARIGVRRYTRYAADGLTIDLARWEARLDGQRVGLTGLELRLVVLLAANAGRVLTNRQILERVWGEECRNCAHYLKVYVSRVRRKIERDPHHPRYILTERGIGYRMALPNEREG